MAEKRTVELEIKDNSKSLKLQLKEAVMEVQKLSDAYGATSHQAIEAAKRAGQLKDKIADSKDLVKAFNPDAKFDALSRSIGGVLNGFQAYEGALGLIGVEGEAVQKTLLKVQSAMALAQGLQGLGEAKDSFKQLGGVIKDSYQGLLRLIVGQQAEAVVATEVAVATGAEAVATEGAAVAQLSLNAAMKANPIGLILTGVVLLTAAVGGLVFAMSGQTAEQKKQSELAKIIKKDKKESATFVAKESAEYVGLIYQLKATTRGSKERANLMKEINGKYGTTLTNLRNEAAFQEQLNQSVRNYVEAQRQKFLSNKYAQASENNLQKQEEIRQNIRELNAKKKEASDKINNLIAANQKLEFGRDADYDRKQRNNLIEGLKNDIEKLNIPLIYQHQLLSETEERMAGYGMGAVKAGAAIIDVSVAIEGASDSALTNTKSNQELIQSLKDLQAVSQEFGKNETQLLDIKKQRDLDALQLTFDNSLKDKAAIQALTDAKVLIEVKYNQDIAVIKAKFRQEEITKEDAQFALHEEATYSEKEKEIAALVKTYEDKFALAGDNSKLEQELIIKQKEELKAIQENYAAKELETTTKTTEETVAIKKKAGDKEFDDKKLVEDHKRELLEQGLNIASQGFQLLAQLGEKNKGIQKAAVLGESAVGIAKMIIANKLANVAALATPQAVATSGVSAIPVIAMNNISTGLGVAANIAATAKALQALGGGSAPNGNIGGGTNGGGGGTNGGGGIISPTFNVVGNNGINQLAQLQQQPLQAYVVSGEVTSAQALDRNRMKNATL